MVRGKADTRNGSGTGYAAPASTPLIGLAATFAFTVLVGMGLMEGWPQPTPWLKHEPAVLATLDLAPPPPKAVPPPPPSKVSPSPPERSRGKLAETRSDAAAPPGRQRYGDARAVSRIADQSAAVLQPNPAQSPKSPTVAPTSLLLPAALPKTVARADNAALRQSYATKLWGRIAARRPQGVHMAGSAKLQFTLDTQGRLINVTLARSSGNPLLDRMALTTVRRAQPFSPPPATLAAEDLTFLVDFNFDDL